MNILSIPIIIMATVAAYVGFYHLYIYFRREFRHREDLTFAITCLAMSLYDIFSIGMYNAGNISNGIIWQRAQIATLALIGIAFIWFVADYTGYTKRRWMYVISAFFSIMVLFQLVITNRLFYYRDQPAIKNIELPFNLKATFYEVKTAFLTDLLSAVGILVFLYTLWMAIRFYRKGNRIKAKPLLWSLLIFFLGYVNDVAVLSGFHHFIYTIEYAYLGIVLLMAYSLSNAVVESAVLKEAFEESEKKYRELVDNSLVGIYVAQNHIIQFCNQQLATMFGYMNADSLTSKHIRKLVAPKNWKDVEREITMREQDKKIVSNFQFQGVKKNGDRIDIEGLGSRIMYGGAPAVQGTLIDITARKKAEEKLKASLTEKEVLLQEIHHRVKNNLQIVSSLLSLQARHIQDKEFLQMYKESQDRIRSMSLVHERLYKSKDLARINFREYIVNLTDALYQSHGINTTDIALDIHIKNLYLSIEMAIPCGLLINELLSNTLKHAFPHTFKGKPQIKIKMKKNRNNTINLLFSDNGIGIPKHFDFKKTESLGLELVTVLAEGQLEGNITLNREQGTHFHIQFKIL
ncbi:histidine kinase dimerization/phosphoacceptor domain -containing protein [bacterium]